MMNTQFMVIPVFLWAGMILGISFLESWVKFRTPHLDRPVGLEVGQTVFSYFHLAQWIWFFMMLILAALMSFPIKISVMVSLLMIILYIQYFFIFPALKKRVSIILKGKTPKASFSHTLYGILEAFKFFILIGLGVRLL